MRSITDERLIPNVTTKGAIRYHGVDLYGPGIDPVEVRRRIGMVFQNRTRSRNRFTTT